VIHDVGIDHGVEFLVMEHLPGETLATKLAKGALAPQQVLRYAIQITSAVAAAHHAGILHRDIKPSNVIVNHDGHVKVLDFGIAKLLPQHTATRSTGLTEAGLVLGTVAYMAPEQARASRQTSAATCSLSARCATRWPRGGRRSLGRSTGACRRAKVCPADCDGCVQAAEFPSRTAVSDGGDIARGFAADTAQTAGSGSPFGGRVAIGAGIVGIVAAGELWWMRSDLAPRSERYARLDPAHQFR
jgi:serine/threonine protein kinase